MTDQHFQTPPLPPKAPDFKYAAGVVSENVKKEQPSQIPDIPSDDFATHFKLSKNIYKTKTMLGILGGALFAGLLLGMMFFGGGSSAPAPAPSGLQGVIQNPDIQAPLARCGTVIETEPCIVYIVNHTRRDQLARDFFDQAAKLTGRQPHLVAMVNRQYATSRIPPGYISKIQVPRP